MNPPENCDFSISEYHNVDEVYSRIERLIEQPIRPLRSDEMDSYLKAFEQKYASSKPVINHAKKFIPGGVQHNLAFNYPFPIVFDRAEGAYLYDKDGNRHIDFLQAGGPTVLGSNYPSVKEKILHLIHTTGPSTGEGEAHIYLGTSAWAGITTGRNLKHKNGAVVLQSAGTTKNLLVGITESAGSNLEWMIEKFYKYEKDDPAISDVYSFINKETEGIPPGSDHLLFTPWLLGERCPVSTTTTRGTVFNLGLEHTRGHFVRALLEGVAFNLRWIFENYDRDFEFKPSRIRAIGGGSVNDQWMQGIADITGRTVETITQPTMAGAFGAASCVFVGSRIYRDFHDIKKYIEVRKTFTPDPSTEKIYDRLFHSYKDVYKGLKKAYFRANLDRFNR